jgi:hypothetical protein
MGCLLPIRVLAKPELGRSLGASHSHPALGQMRLGRKLALGRRPSWQNTARAGQMVIALRTQPARAAESRPAGSCAWMR